MRYGALFAYGSTQESGLAALMGRPRLEHRTNRKRPISVAVSDRDRAKLEELAAAAGVPLSAYLRSAGLGQPIRSNAFNHQAVMDLAKLNADQGRLGGLLKLWLVDRPGQGAPEIEVRRLLDRIGEMQGKLSEIAGRI